MPRILIAYASRTSSTREIAEEVGKVLTQAGYAVDITPAKKVSDVAGYQAAIIGSGVRFGRPYKESLKLARKASARGSMPVAFFVVCMALKNKSAESRAIADGYVQKFKEINADALFGAFAGALKYAEMGPFFRFVFSRDKSGDLQEGDYRDWEAIRAWAREAAAHFESVR